MWCRIFADVLGVPVAWLRSNETETLGDIIIAAQAMGIRRLRRTLERCWRRRARCFGPMMSGLLYDETSTGFARELYQALKPVFAGGGE
ncbi:MAG: hypothetical protein ACLR0U_18270 [Enterocloster clostridioformis]